MIVERKGVIYEGKAKILYGCTQEGCAIQHFKDDMTAFDNKKHAIIDGKGAINSRISGHLMSMLNKIKIPTHFINNINMCEQLVFFTDRIPIEVVIRNFATGSFVRKFDISRMNMKDGDSMPHPIIEFYSKGNEKFGDHMMSEDHIIYFGIASAEEMEVIRQVTRRINDFLCGVFMGVGINLMDMKLEFGRKIEECDDEDESHVMLIDEISPDSCRLWDARGNKECDAVSGASNTSQMMDKELFRQGLPGVKEAYEEVAKRLGLL